jgi:hypothetical protein
MRHSKTARTSGKGCIAITAILLMAGCATYRTNSSISFSTTEVTVPESKVLITQGTLPDRKYKPLGPVVAEVRKLTKFNKDPTQDQANIVLLEKAKELGADAVIGVSYDLTISASSWGLMTAKGIAVRFEE